MDESTLEENLTRQELSLLPRRDEAALARLFDLWFDRLFGFVRRMVLDEHTAEDLTQEIFCHIYRAIESYDPSRPLGPWLFTIAANKVRDHWRARARRDPARTVSIERDGAAAALPGGTEAPDASLQRIEQERRLRDAIEELPEGMRMTLALRAFEGLSFEEIAAMVQRSEVAVRKRYSRALEALRGRLSEPRPAGGEL